MAVGLYLKSLPVILKAFDTCQDRRIGFEERATHDIVRIPECGAW